MMNINRKYVTAAVGGFLGLVAHTSQAVDFNATATLQNTLAVTVIQDFDLGTVFATEVAPTAADGVAGFVITPDGVVEAPASNSTATRLTSLSAPVPAQGSVAISAVFTLTFPNTADIDDAEFVGGGTVDTDLGNQGIPLVHESGNPSVPDLFLMHFTVGDVSGGASAAVTTDPTDNSNFTVTPDFGATEYVFNVGATVTTAPGGGTATVYQAGIYSGTFTVTAAY